LKSFVFSIFFSAVVFMCSFVSTPSEAITETILDLPELQSFQVVREHIKRDDFSQALTVLDSMIQSLSGKDRQLASFAAGAVASKMDKHDLALGYLKELYDLSHLETYTYYYRGRAYFHKRQFNVAKAYFDKALQNKDIGAGLKDEVNFLSGQIALNFKKGSEAYRKLNPLVRRWRGSQRRAELLEILLEASLRKKVFSSGRYCRWFKDLYVDHPTNEHSSRWGFKDKNLNFKGLKVSCKLKTQHKRSKLKRLYLEGMDEEIVSNLQKIKKSKKEHKVLTAAFHYYKGKPDQALGLLKTINTFEDEYKEKLKLARTAYYAGETDYALSVYKKLFEKEKRSHRRAWLLNEQASLNMELSNFQTAELFYTKLAKDFKRQKYGRQAMWGLPWVQFLSGKHEEAYKGFQKLRPLKERRPWRYSFVQLDQIDYWSARALQKANRQPEAIQILRKISADPMVSYYSILSALRLEDIAQENSSKLTMVDFLNRPWVEKSQQKNEEVVDFLKGFDLPGRGIASLRLDEITPLISKTVQAAVTIEMNPPAEYQMYSKSFMRSADLDKLGFTNAARDELKFVKKKAKTKNLKKRLLEQFKALEDFSNLSRLAALSFSKERHSSEEENSLVYWKQAYPRAYQKDVVFNSGQFDVPTSLIWGIMRAESFFDPKILSPVGARGLLQIMPYTASKLRSLIEGRSPSEVVISSELQSEISNTLLEPEVNVRYGAKYLSRLDKQFSGHLPFIAAAYNAGPHRVKLWSSRFGQQPQDEFTERVPFKETKNYIKKVMRNMFVYSSLYGTAEDVSFLTLPPTYLHEGKVPFAEYWGEI